MTIANGVARAVHEAAREAYGAGLCILPPAEDGSKRPLDRGPWEAYMTRRPTPDELRAWYPGRSGLGVITGAVSGRVECWDFDDRETFTEFVKAAGRCGLGDVVDRIEAGYCDDTPGGGVRWLVRYPEDVEREPGGRIILARRPGREGEPRVKVLIELPAFAIVAPTNGRVHPSGGPYVHRCGAFSSIACYTAEEREALIDLARSFDAMPRAEPRQPTESAPDRDIGERPGDAFAARTSWADILTPHGWVLVYTAGDVGYWRRPGKKHGISATTNHGGSGLLWVFSSSTAFEPDRSYTKFGAFALLEHGGDFDAAARALAREGYGRPRIHPGAPQKTRNPHASGPHADATAEPNRPVALDDFRAYMVEHKYIFEPSRELWPASSVNARLGPVPLLDESGRPILDEQGRPKTIKAATWLDQNRAVEQLTWAPGEPTLIEGRLIQQGGWIERAGCAVFNLYRPPVIEPGDPAKAGPWLEHTHRVFPENAAHVITWLAQRVQRPDEKLNHGLALLGAQGTGKDSIVEGAVPAIGPWNVAEVTATQLLGRFNGFAKSVLLRVSEARDLGDVDRYRLYDHLKIYMAAPPMVLQCDEKNVREYAVPNVCGVIITSNYVDGIYLPSDDRRHYVAHTELTKEDFKADYFTKLYRWYEQEGYRHVAAYLASLDLSGFDPKAPPPKTAGFWRVVDAGRAPEDAELADALDRLGNPEATTLAEIAERTEGSFGEWIRDRRNSRQIPHRMEAVGYVPVRNDAAKDGKWKIGDRRVVIYALCTLTPRDRIQAATALAKAAR